MEHKKADNTIFYTIYSRKSSEAEDRQVLSIPAQNDELIEVQRDRGLVLDGDPRTESRSAKAPGRPVFGQLMQDIQDEKIRGILCWKLDRLARNPVDGGALIWALDQGKLKEIITPSRTFTNTADDKFWMQLEFGMAKKYVDDLSVNVKRGIKKRLQQGWMPGRAPIGYLNDKENGGIIKDPARFHIVRRIWDALLSDGYNVAQIHKKAEIEWGLRTRLCKRSGGRPIARSRVYEILRSPFYCGLILHNGRKYQGKHPPIVALHAQWQRSLHEFWQHDV